MEVPARLADGAKRPLTGADAPQAQGRKAAEQSCAYAAQILPGRIWSFNYLFAKRPGARAE